eukprot:ANDGO_00351.mRNA.1 Ring canal kelch protein
MCIDRDGGAAVEQGGVILATGGYTDDPKYDLYSAELLECDLSSKWRILDARLNIGRMFHCAVSLNSKVFMIGGLTLQYQKGASVEQYDFECDRWLIDLHWMNQERYGFASVVYSSLGCIYAIGGLKDENTELSSVERYDPRRGDWEYVKEMSRGRSCHAAAIGHDLIFAIGGTGSRDDVEIYEPRMDRWFNGPTMLTPRSTLAAVHAGNAIVAIGGMDGETSTEFLQLP